MTWVAAGPVKILLGISWFRVQVSANLAVMIFDRMQQMQYIISIQAKQETPFTAGQTNTAVTLTLDIKIFQLSAFQLLLPSELNASRR